MGCFNPIVGQIGTNSKKNWPNGWVCPYLAQIWVKTTQSTFLECTGIKLEPLIVNKA